MHLSLCLYAPWNAGVGRTKRSKEPLQTLSRRQKGGGVGYARPKVDRLNCGLQKSSWSRLVPSLAPPSSFPDSLSSAERAHPPTSLIAAIIEPLGVVRNLPIFFRNENWSFGGEGVWCLFVSEIISIVDLCTCTIVNGVCTICARCICTDTIVT